MDFVIGLPKTRRKNDTVWVIVDRLTKSAHFLPMQVNLPLSQLVELYVSEIVCLHGVPMSIVSDRDTVYIKILEGTIGNFWYYIEFQNHLPSSNRWLY